MDASAPSPRTATRARTTAPASDGDSRSARRQDLVTLAADLFAEKGYRATTVREIADAAGVLSGSLYHHFESKESIIDELLTDYLAQILGEYRAIVAGYGDPREALQRLVAAAIQSLEDHRAAITVLQNERYHLSQLDRFSYLQRSEAEVQDLWVGVIAAGIETGVFRSRLNPKMAYRFIRDAIWVAVRWFRPSGDLSAAQLTDQYVAMLMDGVAEPQDTVQPA